MQTVNIKKFHAKRCCLFEKKYWCSVYRVKIQRFKSIIEK